MEPASGARSNRLLGAVPDPVFERLQARLEPMDLQQGDILHKSRGRMSHVYFPTDSIISLLYVMRNGDSGEIALVGNEGVLGIALFMGGETMPGQAVVQSGGGAFRLRAEALKEEFVRGGALQDILLRYTLALVTQMAQTAVCNRHHTLEKQLARWLLWTFDRLPSSVLGMTQEMIANMLGVRREGVTEAARKLEEKEMISCGRGRIRILDRAALEAHVCECYGVVKAEFSRLLPGTRMAPVSADFERRSSRA